MNESQSQLIDELSPEKKEEVVKDLYLYDCKMKDEDRRLICQANQQNFNLIFKVITTISTLALGGSALAQLPKIADFHFLTISWLFFILSILFISTELIISIIQTENYIKLLALNDDSTIDAPNNTWIIVLIILSVISMLLGMAFLLISISLGSDVL